MHAMYSKRGVLGFTGGGMRFNSMSPGVTDTPMVQSDVAKEAKQHGISNAAVWKEFVEQGSLGR